MRFRDLKIADTFDFISPNIGYNSFFKTCLKISARKYVVKVTTRINHKRCIEETHEYKIGSIDCEVYHVNEEKEDEQSK